MAGPLAGERACLGPGWAALGGWQALLGFTSQGCCSFSVSSEIGFPNSWRCSSPLPFGADPSSLSARGTCEPAVLGSYLSAGISHLFSLCVVYKPRAGCFNERRSLRNLCEGENEHTTPRWGWLGLRRSPLGSVPTAHSPCSVCWQCCHNKRACVSFWVGGEGAGLGANNWAFQILGLLSFAYVCSFG